MTQILTCHAAKKYYVYALYDPRTQPPTPVYIGKGVGKRVLRHIRGDSSNNHVNCLQRHLSAIGKELIYEILESFESEQEALDWEIALIASLGRLENGGVLYNFTDGGEGASGCMPSAETRAKIGDIHRGKKYSPETRAKMSAAKRMPEAREKARASGLGKPLPPETRAKMSAAKRGNKYSLGNKNRLGKSHTPETKAKMSVAHLGKPHKRRAQVSPAQYSLAL